ncbi:hypothetical protein BH10PSE19_BH10PSE19_00690 [soil metagenome]
MEEVIKNFSGYIALILEAAAVVVITMGGIQAIVSLFYKLMWRIAGGKQQVWQGFAVWLILGLEFMLAADILRTVIAPTWDQLGQLAVIALIRTFLNYFLEKDLIKTA